MKLNKAKKSKEIKCPKCDEKIWDIAKGYKLNKCWNCMLAFDTINEEEL
jgi:hypothetical protein